MENLKKEITDLETALTKLKDETETAYKVNQRLIENIHLLVGEIRELKEKLKSDN